MVNDTEASAGVSELRDQPTPETDAEEDNIVGEPGLCGCKVCRKLERQRDELAAALRLLDAELECYCADNVAAKGECGMCNARAALSRLSDKGEA